MGAPQVPDSDGHLSDTAVLRGQVSQIEQQFEGRAAEIAPLIDIGERCRGGWP